MQGSTDASECVFGRRGLGSGVLPGVSYKIIAAMEGRIHGLPPGKVSVCY